MRLLCLALATAAMAPATMSQPVPPELLPPVEVVAARLAADGLLPDSLYDRLQRDPQSLTRSVLLWAVAMHLGEQAARPVPARFPSSPDSLVEAVMPSFDAALAPLDRLRAAGAITARTHRIASERFATLDAAMQPGRDSLRAVLKRGERVAFVNPFLFGMINPALQAIPLAIELTEREEHLDPERWAPLLDALVATGHLGPDERARILGALASGEAASLGDVLRLLPRVVVVNPDALPSSLGDVARAVADTLATRLGETGVSDLHLDTLAASVETRPGWDSTSTQWTLVLTADADGWRYAAESGGHTFTRNGRTHGAPAAYDAATAVAVLLNKVLRDRGLPHRVYVAHPDAGDVDEAGMAAALAAPDGVEPPRSFVLAVLTAAEAALYRGRRGNGILHVGLPGFDDGMGGAPADEARFTTERVAADVALLARLGLVADSVLERGRARLARAYVTSPGHVFGALGLTWSTYALDVSTEYESPFGALLRALAGISRGAFAPADVEEPFDGGRVALAFTLGGRRVATDLVTWETGFDAGFLPLVNRSLAEAGADGRFLDLEPESDESATYLFVTAAQERALVAAGLLTDSE